MPEVIWFGLRGHRRIVEAIVVALLGFGGRNVADEQARPASLTLIGGKLDTRINPTRVDSLTRTLRLEWFEDYAIVTASAFRPGRARRVYPGGAELMMLSTYLLRHCASGGELLAKIPRDDGEDPVGHPFLKLFFSVVDVPAEFFLDTIARVP